MVSTAGSAFTRLIDARRRELDLTQAQVAAAAKSANPTVDQSLVAKLEKGKVAMPSAGVLEGLAVALDLPYERLVAAVVKDRYLDEDTSDRLYPLEKGTLTLRELARWEGRKAHHEVWIAAEQYADDQLREFRDAVLNILARENGSVTFFLPKSKEEEFNYEYRVQVASNLGRDPGAQLRLVPLTYEQRAVMAASFVLANPNDATAEFPQGFVIINDQKGFPRTAICMSHDEAATRARALGAFLQHQAARGDSSHLRSIERAGT